MNVLDNKVKRYRAAMLHGLYLRVLKAYQVLPKRKPYNAFRLGFEYLIRLLVLLGAKWFGLQFPTRGVDDWWWTWRWRWEFMVKYYEYETVQWCRQFIRPGMLVLDIGAHIGYFTLLFSDLVGRFGKVIAFEPNIENYSMLLHNITARKCPNVVSLLNALSDFVGECDLFISTGHSTHSLIKDFSDNEGSLSVISTTVDAYLDTIGKPIVDFVKIDVEGAELLVLSGMLETISRNPQIVMVVELNPMALEAGNNTTQDLISQLESLGFISMEIGRTGHLTAPLEHASEITRNLLCIAKEHPSYHAIQMIHS